MPALVVGPFALQCSYSKSSQASKILTATYLGGLLSSPEDAQYLQFIIPRKQLLPEGVPRSQTAVHTLQCHLWGAGTLALQAGRKT